MNNTLIIHPSDPSTDFLKPLYDWIPDRTVIKQHLPDGIIDMIAKMNPEDRLMMMGHGTPGGLLNPKNYGKYVLGPELVPVIKDRNNIVAVWCNANMYAKRFNLHGLFSGMIISEPEEANWVGVNVEGGRKEVYEFNDRLAADLSDAFRKCELRDIPAYMSEHERWHTELTEFNWNNFHYFE